MRPADKGMGGNGKAGKLGKTIGREKKENTCQCLNETRRQPPKAQKVDEGTKKERGVLRKKALQGQIRRINSPKTRVKRSAEGVRQKSFCLWG